MFYTATQTKLQPTHFDCRDTSIQSVYLSLLLGQLDDVQMELMKLDVGQVINDQSEMLPDVLNAAQQQLVRVQQLAELREKQVIKVNTKLVLTSRIK